MKRAAIKPSERMRNRAFVRGWNSVDSASLCERASAATDAVIALRSGVEATRLALAELLDQQLALTQMKSPFSADDGN